MGGNNQNLYDYFQSKVNALNEKASALQTQAVAAQTQADALRAQADKATDPTTKAQLQAAADQYAVGAQKATAGAKLVRAGADKLDSSKEKVKDRYLEVLSADGVSLQSSVLTTALANGTSQHAMSLPQSSILRTTQSVMTPKSMRMV